MIDLTGLASLEPFKRRLAFAGRLRRALGPQQALTSQPIVVGGAALEFYSTGGYSTQDLDLILSDARPAFVLLEQAGFQRQDRYAFHTPLDLLVEFPGKALPHGPTAYERVLEVSVAGEQALVIGIEDLLIGRLHAAVIEGRANDAKWAREMILLHHQAIDWAALALLAHGEGPAVARYLARCARRWHHDPSRGGFRCRPRGSRPAFGGGPPEGRSGHPQGPGARRRPLGGSTAHGPGSFAVLAGIRETHHPRPSPLGVDVTAPLFLIHVRGGSQGIPGKNLREVAGITCPCSANVMDVERDLVVAPLEAW